MKKGSTVQGLRFGNLSKGIALGAFFITGWVLAQMVPDAPIRHFSLPMFGEDGYKSWELKGVEGVYVSANETVVKGLELSLYSGGENLFIENEIRSPEARIYLDRELAEGASSLYFKGNNFEIQGSDWTWEGKAEKLTVRKSARVIFSESIDILK